MSAIIYGPQGCGKTRNAEKLAKYFGLSNILDKFGPGQELPEDTLALTHVPDMEGALNYDDVMLAMQSALAWSVAPEILGMSKIVSDESLRRAQSALARGLLKCCDEAQRAICLAQLIESTSWMDTALSESTREVLNTAWILDADSSVKLLYGHQQVLRSAITPESRDDQVIPCIPLAQQCSPGAGCRSAKR
ncbi:hypothetical protein [Nitrosomonas sp. Nm34]|uniref:hypothetical protein n=1 Tax=Nitrosomonas sp. Nm34 TaxID=1881055 RepID=UPI0008EA3833|nr:hypothetical protein [Nitrosomonas sp. Nm34]SFI74696.1 hypothetical protein SAMN05428978_103213 [Nitrosomonas sp. Nm34]